MHKVVSPYLSFTREQWSQHRLDAPLLLTPADIESLQGQVERVSTAEIEQVYLPLSRLLSFYVTATQRLHRVTGDFLGAAEPKLPFIIGVSGSVAVGKSTTSRVLKALLSRWPDHPRVAVITTDGFLFPNAKLKQLGLMERKGFPESYDTRALLRALHALKSGEAKISVPIYSHHRYDVLTEEMAVIEQPDIVVVEGLNILQTGRDSSLRCSPVFVSDYLDFSLFVDADTKVIQDWYIQRLLTFKETSFQQKDAYFNFLTGLNFEETVKFAQRIWCEINEVNLLENILPYRERAQLILCKSEDHSVETVKLRKL